MTITADTESVTLTKMMNVSQLAETLRDEQLSTFVSEAARRGLIEVDLTDIAPERLVSALQATEPGRKALKATKAGRPRKPTVLIEAIRADVADGMTTYAAAKKHKVAFNTAKRYVDDGKKEKRNA